MMVAISYSGESLLATSMWSCLCRKEPCCTLKETTYNTETSDLTKSKPGEFDGQEEFKGTSTQEIGFPLCCPSSKPKVGEICQFLFSLCLELNH